MSLEEALKANTEAVLKLVDELRSPQPQPADIKDVTTPAAKADKKVPQQKQVDTVFEEAVKAPVEEPATPKIERKDISKIILSIAGKDRAQAVALLARFGATSGTNLAEEHFADFVAAAGALDA